MEWLLPKLAAYESDITILLRLLVATFAGMVIGLNRDRHNKPVGMRTLALVSLSAAAVVLSGTVFGEHFQQDAASRVMQGILTGVGFLGAGVIMRGKDTFEVHGLTTASTVWIAAALGITSGLGAWFITFTGIIIALLLLTVGKPLEYALIRMLGGPDQAGSEGDPKSAGSDQGHNQP
ncbi:MgtC/SapB family protein [Microvirga terricola]|uniref:Protein MgtC n=1 Tax=Microvirga terricola TaxID=2719797 RepID=A0ABX0VEW4_9HYPH|nr:MgtC/SapB family protein [Microvirga terricola]NIX77706.1 MgtC/SapB family protein [Microvirga terricola]